jgi:hypothetical protein
LPSEPLVSAGEALRNLAVPRALGGVLDWFAGGFDFLALGLKALPQLAAGA